MLKHNGFLYIFSEQGKQFPKTEQKFENYAKNSFRISDKQVSNFVHIGSSDHHVPKHSQAK